MKHAFLWSHRCSCGYIACRPGPCRATSRLTFKPGCLSSVRKAAITGGQRPTRAVQDVRQHVGLQYLARSTSDGFILIDATTANGAETVLANIRKLKFDPANIKYVLISHGHNDHFGGAGQINKPRPTRVGVGPRLGSHRAAAGLNGSGLPLTKDRCSTITT